MRVGEIAQVLVYLNLVPLSVLICMDVAYDLHTIYIVASSPPRLERLPPCLFMQNLLTRPAVQPPSSWGGRGAELGIRVGLYTLLYLNFLSLPYPSSLIPLPPPQDSPTPQQQTNMGGGTVEQEQPRVQTQDSQRLEEDRATHSPSAREEEGPSGAT